MKRTFRSALITIGLAVLALTPTTLAWNSHGHMLVAAVAYQQLTPTVRARVDVLIVNPSNPLLAQWQQQVLSVAATDRKQALFAIAATFPDEIKSTPGFIDDGERPSGPTAAQNVGFTDKLQHRYWHFVDQPFAIGSLALPAVPSPNAADRVAQFKTTLASGAPDALKSYDLVWLEHLVGDIHQPLHAATRVSAAHPAGDSGGNLVPLCAPPCKQELHAFWDDALGTDQSPAGIITAAKRIAPAAGPTVNDLDPMHWAAESLTLAKTTVYVPPIGPGPGPFTTTPTYQSAAQALSAQRVALAGARLAAMLNANVK